ncbi:unnamed protein product [Ectocarpus sp. 6 AP-2014]
MANRSFLLCQKWLKYVFPSLSILTISLPAFSNHFLLPSTATVLSSLFHASNISLYVPCIFPSSVMCTSLSGGACFTTSLPSDENPTPMANTGVAACFTTSLPSDENPTKRGEKKDPSDSGGNSLPVAPESSKLCNLWDTRGENNQPGYEANTYPPGHLSRQGCYCPGDGVSF